MKRLIGRVLVRVGSRMEAWPCVPIRLAARVIELGFHVAGPEAAL